jgi:predicted phosphodiesterase
MRRAAGGGPILFAGDLTDSGTPLEASVLRDVARAGRPFVFVTGNHDSDTLGHSLARSGAIVLTQQGRLTPRGRHGAVVVHVGGVRVAGYSSPNERRAADGFADRGANVTIGEQAEFEQWLFRVAPRVDVVMVHEPKLAAPAVSTLRARGGLDHPLLLVTGHTHRQAVTSSAQITEVNGGTVGAGGTGNLAEGQDLGLAQVTIRPRPFAPLAVDLVQIDPGDGSATARRVRLTGPPVATGQ